MALDARHRSSLYQKFVPILGEDDANALMSEFPASEATELVTKQFLRAELAELRSEMGGLRPEMAALENRMTLKRAMEAEGFQNYDKEWWHYRIPANDTPLDAPLSCFR